MDIEIADSGLIAEFTATREGETKIGETIKLVERIDDLSNLEDSHFVIIGIPEDIGPRANMGQPGAQNGWRAFLKKFLNMQDNRFMRGEQICLLGQIKLDDLDQNGDLRALVEQIDDRVTPVIRKILENNHIPIVIGGGHNNCFPILRGCAKYYGEPVDCINIDPHSDLRDTEGRHSGNGFSYAMQENYLDRYFILGLHEQYNSDYLWNKIEDNNAIAYTTFDQFLDGHSLENMVMGTLNHVSNNFGLELDMDAIANMPSSALSPSGFSLSEARKLIRLLGAQSPMYLHLPEGAPKDEHEETIVGKALAYLVSDFIKAFD